MLTHVSKTPFVGACVLARGDGQYVKFKEGTELASGMEVSFAKTGVILVKPDGPLFPEDCDPWKCPTHFDSCDRNGLRLAGTVSQSPESSERPLEDSLWNRSFHGHPGPRTIAEEWGWKVADKATALCKSTKSRMTSCLDWSRKALSKRGSTPTINAAGDSTSSSDTLEQVKSDQFNVRGSTEKEDGDEPAFEGWMDRSVKSGSRMEQASGKTNYLI